jgi:hypothetical protein
VINAYFCRFFHARCDSVIDHSDVGNSEGDSVSSDDDVSFVYCLFSFTQCVFSILIFW